MSRASISNTASPYMQTRRCSMTRGLATSRSRNDMHFPAFSSRLSVISAQCHCFFFVTGDHVCVWTRVFGTRVRGVCSSLSAPSAHHTLSPPGHRSTVQPPYPNVPQISQRLVDASVSARCRSSRSQHPWHAHSSDG